VQRDNEHETFSRSEASDYRVGAAAGKRRTEKGIVFLRRRRDICDRAQYHRLRSVDHRSIATERAIYAVGDGAWRRGGRMALTIFHAGDSRGHWTDSRSSPFGYCRARAGTTDDHSRLHRAHKLCATQLRLQRRCDEIISRTGSARFNSAGILFPLGELLNFGVLVGAGLWYRHRPDIHKRLMLLAMVPILVEPIIHLVGHLAGRWPTLRGMGTSISVAVTLLLLSASAIYDRLSRRRIHPVSLWVPIVLFGWQIGLGFFVFPSAAWRKFVAWLIV
jgi:hypothetical protein